MAKIVQSFRAVLRSRDDVGSIFREIENMKNKVTVLCCWALFSAGLPALAQDTDPNQCLECHEPAEDWAGMTLDEIVVAAKDPENKRHERDESLTDEQLKLMIVSIYPESDE
jgi:hypothetical protein